MDIAQLQLRGLSFDKKRPSAQFSYGLYNSLWVPHIFIRFRFDGNIKFFIV